MRAVLLTVLLVAGCSKKSEKNEGTNEGAPVKPAASEDKQTPEDKAGELAAKPPAPAPAAPKIDCAALVTPADVAKACGGANVEIVVNESEGKNHPLGTCWRSLAEPGKKLPVAHVILNGFSDAAGAEGWVKLEQTDDTKPVAGIGDLAWSREAAIPGTKTTEREVGVRKGTIVLRVMTQEGALNKNPPCNLGQLTELARLIAARLP